jgi:hypothetical protein
MWVTSQSFAGLTVTLYTQSDGQPSGYRDPKSYGGEFTAVLSGNTALNTYELANYSSKAEAKLSNGSTGIETFCIEINQVFSPGTSYNAQIENAVVPGGPDSYIALGTAYLYSQFAMGTLSDFTYSTSGTGRELTSDELQDAIWYLQGEITSSGKVSVSGSEISTVNDSLYTFNALTDPFILLAEEAIEKSTNSAALAAIEANGNGAYNVLALDLTGSKGQTAQDQLIYCPVPEPATVAAGAILLFPLGFSTIRALRKNKKSRIAISKNEN